MKLKAEILKIKCMRTSADVNPDKIYSVLYFFTGNKVGDDFVPDKNSLVVKVSDVEQHIKKDYVWKPKQNLFEFDLGANPVFGMTFSLYEMDNAKIYDKLKAGDTGDVKEALNLSGLKLPANPAVPADWIQPAVKILAALFKYARQDDRLGSEPFAYHINDASLGIAKSFEFKKLFSHYEIVLNFTLTN
jgi:hypothetical protein